MNQIPAMNSSWLNPANRIRPLQAWRAMRALINDPDDTAQVFRIIEALKGGSLVRAVRRLDADPAGQKMLRTKPNLIEALNDRAALRALPDGSLGRAYLDFVQTQQLSADGLVEASDAAPALRLLEPNELWMANRLRDIHDLQHVLTGYGRDELGELCLLSFMKTQTRNRGIAFIVFMGSRKYREVAPGLPIDDCVREGQRIAEAASWLPAISWESRLGEPLQALREELGLRLPQLYYATRERWPQGAAHAATT